MDTHAPLPFSVALDDSDDPADVIDALALEPFVAGTQPAARSARLERIRDDAALLPAGIVPVRTARGDDRQAALARGAGWTLRYTRWSDASATVTVTAETDEMAADVLAQATKGACDPLSDDGPTVAVAFWHRSCNGQAHRASRDIEAIRWSDVESNYTAPSRAALERLVEVIPPAAGRLILLHGPPGTGKTTALRALAAAWRPWCRTEVVVDAERLYGDAAYLTAVLLGRHDDEGDDRPAWRLVILEDCDELLRADAKKESGQALGRLLNVTDGFLGQGLELLVALTTNEPIGALHPAVVRPGRCLAEIHVGRLTGSEATRWLGGERRAPAEGATLAELFALRGTDDPVREPSRPGGSGTYL